MPKRVDAPLDPETGGVTYKYGDRKNLLNPTRPQALEQSMMRRRYPGSGYDPKEPEIRNEPPQDHSNPTEYWGPGEADGAVSDNAGPLQAIDPSEQMDQNVDGPDEFFCDWGNRPDLEWPGEKVRQRGRRQAY